MRSASAPDPEIDRVHGVVPGALVISRVGSHADGPEPPVQDVAFVGRAVHPAPEDRAGLSERAAATGYVLGIDAPVVPETVEAFAHALPVERGMGEVVLFDHLPGMRTGRPGKPGVGAQGFEAAGRAVRVVQREEALLL